MKTYANPFEFEAATNLSDEMILDVYIEDYNYTRFIQSQRNVFLLGDRGSGKSMTLIYNSFRVRKLQAKRKRKAPSLDYIGVYIPCNTPLTHKKEHQLLDSHEASVISEHYLVLSMIYNIADTLTHIENLNKDCDRLKLKSEIEYILRDSLPSSISFFESIKLYVQSQLARAQQIMNSSGSSFIDKSFSFTSAVLPLFNLIRKLPKLEKSHFFLMIDDAHDLNLYQRRALNSWIAYRDHSIYSFKVAAAKVSDFDYLTLSGGTILEGHDFISIDMEGDFQGQYSRFGKLAEEIIQRRLNKFKIKKSPETFFPTNPNFLKDLKKCEDIISEQAKLKFPSGTKKQINDHVYKYARAEYFRQRSSRANLPPYSGFEMLVHLSTGVIRNFLEPCYWMYDDVFSISQKVTKIPPSIQNNVIIDMSEKRWKTLEDGLEKVIEDCSRDQAEKIYNLFDNLAILFRERLLHHKSEPRAIVFTVSGINKRFESELMPLFDIARKAQLLYLRRGVAKSYARKEKYYVPNRMLWPSRGLDPHGQHARVSLKAIDIINATKGKKFPFVFDDLEKAPGQEEMF